MAGPSLLLHSRPPGHRTCGCLVLGWSQEHITDNSWTAIPGIPVHRLRDVLGSPPPDVARQEQALAITPLPARLS